MTPSTTSGLALTIVAGLMSGNCMLPSKLVGAWKWENMWAMFSVMSLVVFPWTLALLLIDHLGAVYGSLTPSQLLAPVIFGAGWGVAQILFGISIARLGLGLAYAIIVGMGAALGTVIPLLSLQSRSLDRSTLWLVFLGLVLMVLGIVTTTWGGRLRERVLGGDAPPQNQTGYRAAVLLAVLCGFLAPMLNYAFAFGHNIAQQAVALGNSDVRSAYAVWPIALAGGFLTNAAFTVYLLARNRSWAAFGNPLPDALWSTLMAVLWMGAFSVYGMSTALLGDLGTSIGWGLFQIFMIMTASLSGALTGEWKGATAGAKACLAAGMALLTVATLLLTAANRR